MSGQCQTHAPSSHSHPKAHEDADRQLEEAAVTQAAARDADAEAVLEMTDDLLAEIDEALAEAGSTSELAAAFVASYQQRSGE